MFQRLLIVWLSISSAIAFYWTTWFPGIFDPFGADASGYYLKWLIVATMFAIGLLLPRDEVDQVFRRWPIVIAGTGIQYTTMPLLAFVVATAGGFEDAAFVGIVVVGCVPGAMASNVLTLNALGNTSYSVSLTTVATVLSPIAVPLALGLTLAADESVDRQKLVESSQFLLLVVVVPVVVGHVLGRALGQRQRAVRSASELVANVAILLIIAAVVGRSRAPLREIQIALVVALLALNVGGFLAGYFGGKALGMPEAMRRALTLEVGMQNAGLGAALALELFRDLPGVGVAPALYTFGCMFTGTVLATWWSTRAIRQVSSPSEPRQDPG